MKFFRIKALLLKFYYISISRVDRLLDIIYWPVVTLLLWGFTTKYVQGISGVTNIANVFIGGVILWSIFTRAQQDIAVYILEDFWSRNVKNLFITPVTEMELCISTMILGIFRAILSFVALFFIALFFYSFNILNIGAVSLALFMIPLMLFGWAIGIAISGLIFRYGMRVQVFAWGFSLLLQPIGAIFYPVDVLPTALQKVAFTLPLMHIFEGFRQSFDNVISINNLSWAYGLSVIYLILGYIFFVTGINRSRKNGFLADS